jgi:hypothetical protein
VLVVEVATEISITLETELELGSHCGDIVGSVMSLEWEAVVLGVLDISKEVFKKQYVSWTWVFTVPLEYVQCVHDGD